MKRMIKEYQQETDFVNAGAGTSTWCIATKGGRKYFIKSFLEVTLVDEETAKNLPAPMVEAKRKSCIQFRVRKERLYNMLNRIQNGVFISPIELIVYNGHFCAVTDYLESFGDSDNIHEFSPRRKTILMRTLVLAMRDLSNNHIVHSDIKPDNIVITYNQKKIPQLKIIDFDSGFFEDAPPHNVNEYHGDMVYFAPESMVFLQSEGESDVRLTCAVDKFAVGLLLHKMWCGMLPTYDTDECVNVAEALLLDKPIKLHGSIPQVLSAVINGFLQEDPDARMSYEQAYGLLGEYLRELPADPEPEPEPVPSKKAEVKVVCVDTNGRVLESKTLELASGSGIIVVPKAIDGYECLDSKRDVHVDATGHAEPSNITFRYKKKKHSAWMWLIAFLAAALLWWLYTCGNANAAINRGNWEQASRYSSLCPFYDSIFPRETAFIHYHYGIQLYHSKEYSRAMQEFTNVRDRPIVSRYWLEAAKSADFHNCANYITLCSAHMYGADQYFDSLIKMGYFEDAESLVLEGINTARADGDWEKAHLYISQFPRYEYLYPEKANAFHYDYGVHLYHLQQYEQAYAELSSMSSEYLFSANYLTLCRAHINGAESCLDALKEILWFQDANELILCNAAAFQEFMLGTWDVTTRKAHYPDFAMGAVGDGHYWMSNIPDSPGGGNWWYKEGIIKYVINDVTQDLHKVDIVDKNSVTFTNCSTQTVYYLYRKLN